MQLSFSKMHGLGNDFVVIDTINQAVDLGPEQIRYLADRHLGIGCDQLLLIEAAASDEVDFNYRIFNADGGEVAQCGNGARCFARYVRDHGLTDKDHIRVSTSAGTLECRLLPDNLVCVDMGQAHFAPADIPLHMAALETDAQAASYRATLAGQTLEFYAVSMGNPHAVILVDELETAPVSELAPVLQSQDIFPQGVNVGFMQITDRDHVRLRVYERGSGETQACGSGACAAMVAGRQAGLLNDMVEVELTGGTLIIEWAGQDNTVLMTGPAIEVFSGNIEL